MLLPGQGREVGARRGRSTSALLASSFTGCSSCSASSMPVLRCFALVCDDAESKTTAGLDAGAVSSIHSRHPGGGAGHSGEGRQPGGGTQPGGGAGQFGGGLNRYPIPSRSPPLQSRTAPHYPPIDGGTCDYAPAARSTAGQRVTRSRAETQVRLMTSVSGSGKGCHAPSGLPLPWSSARIASTTASSAFSAAIRAASRASFAHLEPARPQPQAPLCPRDGFACCQRFTHRHGFGFTVRAGGCRRFGQSAWRGARC